MGAGDMMWRNSGGSGKCQKHGLMIHQKRQDAGKKFRLAGGNAQVFGSKAGQVHEPAQHFGVICDKTQAFNGEQMGLVHRYG